MEGEGHNSIPITLVGTALQIFFSSEVSLFLYPSRYQFKDTADRWTIR